jgi:hypothetical protein
VLGVLLAAKCANPPSRLRYSRRFALLAALGDLSRRTGEDTHGRYVPPVGGYFFSSVDSSVKILRSTALNRSSVLALSTPTSVSSGA